MLSPCGVMLGGGCRYGSHWKESEAEKNLLRTHTTAVSSRMLYKLAQEGFKPAKYFSIDRVFATRPSTAPTSPSSTRSKVAALCSCTAS